MWPDIDTPSPGCRFPVPLLVSQSMAEAEQFIGKGFFSSHLRTFKSMVPGSAEIQWGPRAELHHHAQMAPWLLVGAHSHTARLKARGIWAPGFSSIQLVLRGTN